MVATQTELTTALAVFVKTPEYSPVKTRLAETLGQDNALAVYEACLTAMKALMRETHAAMPTIVPYWAVGEEAACAHPRWQDFPGVWTGEGGLGERLHHIYSTLLARHSRVILIGSDCPQIRSQTLITAACDSSDFVFGPSSDGGFYLFAAHMPIAKSVWCSVPYSQADTMAVLSKQLKAQPNMLQATQTTLPTLTDIDTTDSLKQVLRELKNQNHPTHPSASVLEAIMNRCD